MSGMVLIGNAPSSGSTFLAELLDSTPWSACGPELNLFSMHSLYSENRRHLAVSKSSSSPSLYVARNSIPELALPAYGFCVETFDDFLKNHHNLNELAAAFSARFLALRSKPQHGLVFEKTPENIGAIGDFLQAFPDGRFVHVVRHPGYVYASLLRRGFPPYIAMYTWLIDMACWWKYRNDERVLLVHYEALVEDPVGTVTGVLRHCYDADVELDSESFMQAYKENLYPPYFGSRLNSWSVRKPRELANANERELPDRVWQEIAAALEMQVSEGYAELFNLPVISFREAIDALGYGEIVERTKGLQPARSIICPDAATKSMLMKKMLYCIYEQRSLHMASCIMNPVTRCC